MSSCIVLNMNGKIRKLYVLIIMECTYINKTNICQYLLYLFVLIHAVHSEMMSLGTTLNRRRGSHLVWSH